MDRQLTRLDFEPLVGHAFALVSDRASVTLELSAVSRLGDALRGGGAFALHFAGPPQPALPQATYAVSHTTLGQHHIFLVPIARTAGGMRYEAIFT